MCFLILVENLDYFYFQNDQNRSFCTEAGSLRNARLSGMTKYSFSWNSNAQIIYAYRLRSILTNYITLITFGGTYYLIIILP